MPDHLHWLIQRNEYWPLSGVVKTLKARSALTINRHRCQSGSLWQGAYYDRAAKKLTIFGALLDILSRIRCERVWYRILATTRIGTVSG
ncbi:MAG: transposase [Thiogranum sp.]